MRDLNKIIVSGRPTKDAEYKEANSLKIATFTIACNYDNRTSFLPVTCFNSLANIAEQFITKGKAIQVEGYLKQERFRNKEGQNVNRIKIIAQKIHLQGNGKSQEE